jgi:hypothetical protein
MWVGFNEDHPSHPWGVEGTQSTSLLTMNWNKTFSKSKCFCLWKEMEFREKVGLSNPLSYRLTLKQLIFQHKILSEHRTKKKIRLIHSIICGTQWCSCLRHYATRVWFPTRSLDFLNLPYHSCRTMILRSTQPLTEMSTRNLPRGKERPARKAGNLTAICEPIM